MDSRTKKFIFKGQEYEVSFPTIGEYLKIEELKLQLSNNKYSDLLAAQTFSALRAVQIVETIAVLSILCPSLFGNMKVKNAQELDSLDFIELIKVYQKEIAPWYNQWFMKLNASFEDIQKENKELDDEEKEVDEKLKEEEK